MDWCKDKSLNDIASAQIPTLEHVMVQINLLSCDSASCRELDFDKCNASYENSNLINALRFVRNPALRTGYN